MNNLAPSLRNRPPGLAPKGSSWGLGLITTFAPGIPALTIMAASAWLPGGVDVAYPMALIPVGLWAIIAIPLIIGFKSRRYWGVVLFFWVGLFCAIALPIAVIGLSLLYLLTIHHQPPEYYYIYMGALLLLMVPFWPFLIRALRLKYWQPWTRPDEWEVGDERIADWVFVAAGLPPRNLPPIQPKAAASVPAKRRQRRR